MPVAARTEIFIKIRGKDLTVEAVVEEGACPGEVRHTCQGEHQEAVACPVLEAPACQAACRAGEDRQAHPCREEDHASSAEGPWVSVHTCPAEAPQEVASVDRHSLAEVLVPEALASSGPEDACLEEVLLEGPASDAAHTGLEAEVQGVSLPESDPKAEACKSRALQTLEAAAASSQEQVHPLLEQALQVPVALDLQVQWGCHALQLAPLLDRQQQQRQL